MSKQPVVTATSPYHLRNQASIQRDVPSVFSPNLTHPKEMPTPYTSPSSSGLQTKLQLQFPVPIPTGIIPPTSPQPWNDSISWPPNFPNTLPKVSSPLFQPPAWHTQPSHTLPCPIPSPCHAHPFTPFLSRAFLCSVPALLSPSHTYPNPVLDFLIC